MNSPLDEPEASFIWGSRIFVKARKFCAKTYKKKSLSSINKNLWEIKLTKQKNDKKQIQKNKKNINIQKPSFSIWYFTSFYCSNFYSKNNLIYSFLINHSINRMGILSNYYTWKGI